MGQAVLYSECGHPVAHDYCAQAPTPSLCELDGFSATTDNFTHTNDPVDDMNLTYFFCGDNTDTHDNMWIKFVADGPYVTFSIQINNCLGNEVSTGIQVAIAETDCQNNYNSLACSNCGETKTVSSPVTPGNTYYLMIDGCYGDICEFVINVVEGIAGTVVEVDIPQEGVCKSATDGNTATLVANTMPVNGDYTYQWYSLDGKILSNPEKKSIEVEGKGHYYVEVFDHINCCSTTEFTEVLIDPTSPIAHATVQDTLDCVHTEATLIGTYEPFEGENYAGRWRTRIGLPVGHNSTETVSKPGTYYYIVKNTRSNCIDTQIVEVAIDTVTPEAIPIFDGTFNCKAEGQSVDLLGENSLPNDQLRYFWINPNGDTISTQQNITIDTTFLNYQLTVVDTTNGCAHSKSIDIPDERGNPIANAGPDQVIDCNTNTVNLEGIAEIGNSISDYFSYQWIDENGLIVSNEANFTTEIEGKYTLLVTNLDSGCKSSDEVEIFNKIEYPEAIILSPEILTCNRQEIILGASPTLENGDFILHWVNSSGIDLGNSNQITISASGTYTLSVLNPKNGCISYQTVEVLQDLSTPTNIQTINGTIDCNSGSVTLSGSVDQSDSDVTYQWVNENNDIVGDNSEISVSEDGVYTLIVTLKSTGCTISKEAIATSNMNLPNATISPEGNTLNCEKSSLQINGFSSTPNTSFSWSGPNLNTSSSSIEVTTPGIYTFSVTNPDNGCVKNIDIEIFEDLSPPEASIQPPNILNCVQDQVSINAKIMNLDDMTYSWTTLDGNILSGVNTLNPMVNQKGTYTLMVTNKRNHCTANFDIQVTENYEIPNIDVGSDKKLTCDVLNVEIGTNKNDNYNLQWFDEQNQVLGDQSLLEIHSPGKYQLIATDTQSGCTSTDFVTVTQDITPPEIDIVGDNLLLDCNHPSLPLHGETNISNPIYEWDGVNGFSASSNSISIDASGQYHLLVKNPINGCTSETSIEVHEDFEIPQVQIPTPDLLTCKVDSIEINAIVTNGINNFTYEWASNNIAISNENKILVTEPGSYQLITTNNTNGCSSTQQIQVNQNILNPNVDAGNDAIMDCATQYVELKASVTSQNPNSSFEYDWRLKGVSVGNTEQIKAEEIGVYTLEVIDANNGCKDMDEIEIQASMDAPDAIGSISNPLTCKTTTAILDASLSQLALNSTGILSYEWYFDGNLISNEATLMIENAGNYQLIVKDNSNNCSDITDINAILDNTPPNLPVIQPDTLTCAVLSIQLDGLISETGNFKYTWLGMNDILLSEQNTLEITTSGNYTLIVENEKNGCSDELSIEVPENKKRPIAFAEVNDELDCSTNEVTISAIHSTTENTVLTWNGNGIIDTSNPMAPIVNQSGVYQLIVQDKTNGCLDTTEVNVIEIENDLEAKMKAEDENCLAKNNGLIEIVDIQGGTPPYEYAINNDSLFSNQLFFEGLAPGNYEVKIQDARGCLYQQNLTVNAWIPPTLELGDDITIELGETVTLYPEFQNINVDSFAWNLNGLFGENPSFQPIEETDVQVTLIDELGCEIQDQLRISINRDYPIYIPNAFTPNHDGINDVFMVFSKNRAVKEISTMQIFDRWGEMVFENHHFLPNEPKDGWDGLIDGKQMQPAVFAYYVQVEFINGEKKLFKGDLTLIL